MAHFAKVENGIVTNVVVVDNEREAYGEQYLNDLGLEGTWIQTSYHGNIRKEYATVGGEYLADHDAFRSPEPEGALGFDFDEWKWIMPEEQPTDTDE
jgi:hypothetical protein